MNLWLRFIHLHLNLPILWLVVSNCIGNSNIDSSLSPKDRDLSLSRLKNGLHSCLCHYKQICQNCLTRHMKSLMLGMYCSVYYDSTPTLLDIHYLLSSWITQHGLSAWDMSESALIATRHGLTFTCCAQHMLLVWHELSKWLKCVDTQL